MTDPVQGEPAYHARATRLPVVASAAAVWTLPFLLLPMFASAGPLESAGEADGPARFEEVCFGDFDDRQEYPTPAELKKVFARVPGQPYEISQASKRLRMGERRIGHVSGLFRLNSPWKDDTTLRLSLIDPGVFQLHFWRGERGVTLRYCPPAVQTWGAYGTTRQGKSPQPSTFNGWALDGGRYRRAGLGTFEVRYHDGNIVLTRGDLKLLSAPLEAPPTEVYLEGSALVRGVLIYRSTGGPKTPQAGPVVLRVPQPAEENWETKLLTGAAFEELSDGAVELSAEANAPAAQAGFHIPGPGLFEYLFEVEDPDVGTGIFLANRDGRQLARLAFYRDRTTGRTTLGYLGPELAATELEFQFDRAMVPYAGQHQWVRLTLGGGVMKSWTSGDGVYWSQSIWSPLAVQGGVGQVGLYCIPTAQKRSIKLRSFQLRRLEALASLAPEAIQERVGSLAAAATLEEWEQRVAEARPSDVPPEVWRRACTVRTLAENPYFSLGGAIIHRLLEDVLGDDVPLEKRDLQWQLKLLDEAAVLIHGLDQQSSRPLQRHYERLGMRLVRQGHSDPLAVISAAVLRTPLWNFDRQNAWPDGLLRHALLARAAEDRWPEVEQLLARLRYWVRPDRLEGKRLPQDEQLQHVIDWAEFQLARGRPAGESPAASPFGRDPFIERLSKEGYNVLAEFRAALDSGAYREACQIISTSADPKVLGLLPDATDRRLLVSLPVAIESAMQRVPALRQAMQQDFQALGELRLNRAVAAGDPDAAEAVTLQFCSTAAASKAHAWLGDRQTSSGRIAQAIGHYKRALQGTPAAQRSGLLARLRLAGALLGRDVGEPVKTTVEIGSARIPAGEFEQTVQQVRQTNRRLDAVDSPPNGAVPAPEPGPPPDRYEAKHWATIDGNEVERPSNMPDRGLDWAARQIAAVVAGERMIVHNQVALAAFDLNTGGQQWIQRQQLGDKKSRWPAVRMRPVVTKTHVFVRRLADKGPELACFDVLGGQLIWTAKPSDYVASDPLLIGQELVALTVGKDAADRLSLRLAEFDPRAGRLLREVPLAEFDDVWHGSLPCRAAEADGKIVATAGACLVCCDLSGRLQWIRRQIWIPPPSNSYSQASTWLNQRHEPPLVVEDRVYATQPGVWNLECLDLQTGRLLWRKAVPELSGLLGRVAERLIVETTAGLMAMDALSGKTLWYHDVEDRLEAWLCSQTAAVVYVRLEPPDDNSKNPRVVLVRLDPSNGTTRETSILDTPPHEQPLLGPLVARGSRTWAFFARSNAPARREILELVALKKGP